MYVGQTKKKSGVFCLRVICLYLILLTIAGTTADCCFDLTLMHCDDLRGIARAVGVFLGLMDASTLYNFPPEGWICSDPDNEYLGSLSRSNTKSPREEGSVPIIKTTPIIIPAKETTWTAPIILKQFDYEIFRTIFFVQYDNSRVGIALEEDADQNRNCNGYSISSRPPEDSFPSGDLLPPPLVPEENYAFMTSFCTENGENSGFRLHIECDFKAGPCEPLLDGTGEAREGALAYVTFRKKTPGEAVVESNFRIGRSIYDFQEIDSGSFRPEFQDANPLCTVGGPILIDANQNQTPELFEDHELVITCSHNQISFYREGSEVLVEGYLTNPHPVTGAYQTIHLSTPLPEDFETQAIMASIQRWLAEALDIETIKHSTRIEGFSQSFRARALFQDFQIAAIHASYSLIGKDTEGTGLIDSFTDAFGNTLAPPLFHDMFSDGQSDYMTFGDPTSGLSSVFFPLSDTNGDEKADSVGFDFNQDFLPDPELPRFAFLAGPETPQDTLQIHFAQFGDGDGIFSQIILFNLDSKQSANVNLDFRNDDGSPMTVDLNGSVVEGSLDLQIPPSGLRIFRSDGIGTLQVGSVTATSDRAVAGEILFGGSIGVAGVGPSHPITDGFLAALETDSNQQVNTGIAVKNLETDPNILQMRLTDENAIPLATAEMTLPSSGHRALFTNEINWVPEEGVTLDFSNFKGLLLVNGSGQVAATVIQVRPGEIATMPIARDLGGSILSRASGGFSQHSITRQSKDLDQKLYFAQFGNGQSGQTSLFSQLILFNPSSEAANVKVVFRDDEGEMMPMDFEGETSPELEFFIPPGQLQMFKSDGLGDIQTGTVTASSDQTLAGVILFGGTSGVAGVGSSIPFLKSFVAPMESRTAGLISTGIAVMNLESEEIQLDLSLVGREGQLLATAEMELPSLGHRALFLPEIDWQAESGVTLDFSDFEGLVISRATGKTTATVVQTRPGVFATQPVAPALN